jgi:hypothetical protein
MKTVGLEQISFSHLRLAHLLSARTAATFTVHLGLPRKTSGGGDEKIVLADGAPTEAFGSRYIIIEVEFADTTVGEVTSRFYPLEMVDQLAIIVNSALKLT